MGGMVALAALIFALDSLVPQGWTPAPLYVAVVASSMWLARLRPIWIAAIACTLLTVLAFFVAPPGSINADLFNRFFSILAICVVALFCVLYKRAERRSLELAAIVKSFGDAIISKNLDGVITTWNAGAERLFGYTAEEVLGRRVTLLFAPEHRDEESRILEAINRGEQITHFETERACKHGNRVPVSLSASPIVDAGGKVVGVATIARDISEQKRVAEGCARVRESAEARRMRFVDHAADAFFLHDHQAASRGSTGGVREPGLHPGGADRQEHQDCDPGAVPQPTRRIPCQVTSGPGKPKSSASDVKWSVAARTARPSRWTGPSACSAG